MAITRNLLTGSGVHLVVVLIHCSHQKEACIHPLLLSDNTQFNRPIQDNIHTYKLSSRHTDTNTVH